MVSVHIKCLSMTCIKICTAGLDRVLFDFLNNFNIKFFYKKYCLWKFNTVGEIGYNYESKSLDFLIKIDIKLKSIDFKEIKEKKQQAKREKRLLNYVNYYL